MRFNCIYFLFFSALFCCCNNKQQKNTTEESLIPFDSRWEYAQLLNDRPSNNQVVNINPPRFSWSYFSNIVVNESDYKHSKFIFQLSQSEKFESLHLNIKTDLNFYNVLQPLKAGRWFWRIGYVNNEETTWGKTNNFIVNEKTPVWDRSVINNAKDIISKIEHPRLCSKTILKPYSAFKEDTLLDNWLKKNMAKSDVILKKDWWVNFPKTDFFPCADAVEIRRQSNWFARISHDIAAVLLVYRITGDAKYSGAIDRYLKIANYSHGGVTSPEWLGALTKMPTQILGHLAQVYDWFYDELNESQKKVLLDAINWRLKEMYFGEKGRMWKSGDQIVLSGFATAISSHAYQNMGWSIPAVLATVGELDISNELLPLLLNYLTGVTFPEGPEEGYNEGTHYSVEKSNTVLDGLLLTDWVLPELNLGKNPVLSNLGNWFIYMFPPGIDRLPFGDAYIPVSKETEERALRKITLLTKDSVVKKAWRIREKSWANILENNTNYPWLELESYLRSKSYLELPEADANTNFVLKEAGWVFMNSQPIEGESKFDETVGMIFQSRSRGGYSHSFASENSFVWYAFGETLSAGGGSLLNKDYYGDKSMAHNTILVNGEGQIYPVNRLNPQKPFFGRLLASHHSKDLDYWVGDATNAYPDTLSLERFYRYVIMVDKSYFIIFDDLAFKDTADAGQFSMLFKVAPKVEMVSKFDNKQIGVSYKMNGVYAKVVFAEQQKDVDFKILKDSEGYTNPVSGKDYYQEMREGFLSRRQFDPDTITPMHNHLWLTNKRDVKEKTFFTVLYASKNKNDEISVDKINDEKYIIHLPNNVNKSISFEEKSNADIHIDASIIKQHAKQSNPYLSKE